MFYSVSFYFSFFFQLLIYTYAIVVLNKLQTEFVDLHYELPTRRRQKVILHFQLTDGRWKLNFLSQVCVQQFEPMDVITKSHLGQCIQELTE